MTALALLLSDLGGGAAAESSFLMARGVDALRRIEAVRRILVAVPPGHRAPRDTHAVPLGADLAVAVEAALAQAAPDDAIVLHDPCRSPVEHAIFERALAELRHEGCVAVVAAAPTTDTLKRAGADGVVRETIDRTTMWEPRTPQIYRAGALAAALARAPRERLTDALRAGDHGYLPALLDGTVRIVPLPRHAVRLERPGEASLVERLHGVSP